MFKCLVVAVLFTASASAMPYPPPPPSPTMGWSCSAASETGQLFISPVYIRQYDAQNEALKLCYQAGSQRCSLYQCVRR